MTIAKFSLFVFACVMLLMAITLYFILIHKQWRAKRWATAQGTILSVGVKSRWMADNSTTNSSGRYFQMRVAYEYVVNGKRYEGHRHGRSSVWLGSEKSARRMADRFTKNSVVEVRHDQDDPRRSMIWPHIGWMSCGVVLLPLLLCGLSLWVALR